jgi:hypothetical protein
MQNAIKNSAEEDEEFFDDNDEVIKCMLIPGKSKFLLCWSLFMALVICISLFLIGVTLAFSLIILDNTRVFEEIIDVVFLIDGGIRCFTAYYHQDVKLVTSRFRIVRRYLFTFLIFDLVSTLPSVFSYQLDEIYFLKIFRVVRILHVIWPLYALVEVLVSDKMLMRKLKESIRLLILFSAIHPLAC